DSQTAALAEPKLPQFIEHGRIAGGHATAKAGILWSRTKNSDPPHPLALLCARGERPRCRRAADGRDKLAAPHSITSSTRPSNGRGIGRPTAFAIFRLTAISIFVACSIGRSAAFSPLRMRPEIKPTLR